MLVLPACIRRAAEVRFNPKFDAAATVEQYDGDRFATIWWRREQVSGGSFLIALLIREMSAKAATSMDCHSHRQGCTFLFGDDVLDWLDPHASVARRDVPGGRVRGALGDSFAPRVSSRPATDAARGTSWCFGQSRNGS